VLQQGASKTVKEGSSTHLIFWSQKAANQQFAGASQPSLLLPVLRHNAARRK
jgi:hypothetical protein